MDPRDLVQILRGLPAMADEGLIVGAQTLADAGVIRLAGGLVSDAGELLLVQTVDFITPVVDDPYAFGCIAAANAISDVYAVGGRPRTALAIAGFPSDRLDLDSLRAILVGGADTAAKAGAVMAGGHTVKDSQLKYGLSVTGVVTAADLVTNAGGQPGDRLILTKPLGTGLVFDALRKGTVGAAALAEATAVMSALNLGAAEAMGEVGVHAATDITGFGLLGHTMHLAQASGVSAQISTAALPLLPGVLAHAGVAGVTGAARRNLAYVVDRLTIDPKLDEGWRRLVVDPQTSGGLLIAVPPDRQDALLAALANHDVPTAAVVGALEAGPPGHLRVC